MSDTLRNPLDAFLVIDGPLKGELRSHDNSTFEVFSFPVPSWMPKTGPATVTEPSYVRYWLREGGDGRPVWSCAEPE